MRVAFSLGLGLGPSPWPLVLFLALNTAASTAWAQSGTGSITQSSPTSAESDPPETGEASEEPPPSSSRVSCLDDASEEGYQRKGVQKRDFLKRRRFELSAVGGFNASDVLSSTYTFGGALSFFPSEDFGVEALVTYAPVQFRLEEPFGAFDGRQRFAPGSALQAMGALLFSPFHAKFKFSDTTIVHGDLFFLGGAGRTFHESVQGISWQAGVGLKLYIARHFAFRLDVRNFVLPQEVLGRGRITNNLSILGGFALWFL
jgi:outer membrane beta-barrel protein